MKRLYILILSLMSLSAFAAQPPQQPRVPSQNNSGVLNRDILQKDWVEEVGECCCSPNDCGYSWVVWTLLGAIAGFSVGSKCSCDFAGACAGLVIPPVIAAASKTWGVLCQQKRQRYHAWRLKQLE